MFQLCYKCRTLQPDLNGAHFLRGQDLYNNQIFWQKIAGMEGGKAAQTIGVVRKITFNMTKRRLFYIGILSD